MPAYFDTKMVVPHEDSITPDEVAKMLAQYKGSTEHGWSEMFNLLAKNLS
jgi:hypothetical protein